MAINTFQTPVFKDAARWVSKEEFEASKDFKKLRYTIANLRLAMLKGKPDLPWNESCPYCYLKILSPTYKQFRVEF